MILLKIGPNGLLRSLPTCAVVLFRDLRDKIKHEPLMSGLM